MDGPVSNIFIFHPKPHWCLRLHAGEHSSQWLGLSDSCHMFSVWTGSHLWTEQGVSADLPILLVFDNGAATCTVCPLHGKSHIPPFVPLFHLLPVCHPQQQGSQMKWHICSRLESFLKSLSCQQLLVWSQFCCFAVNSRRFKQVSKWVLSPIIASYHSRQFHGEMTKLCECSGKPLKMAKDVKLNAEHTDGVKNTLARLASSPYPVVASKYFWKATLLVSVERLAISFICVG